MQTSPALDTLSQLSAENRPCLTSFDSGYEFSLEHWIQVAHLVESAQEEDNDRKGYVFHDSLLTSA